MKELLTIFQLGGWVMYVIGAVGWVALAVFLLKLWHTQRARVFPPDYREQCLDLVRKGELSAARALSSNDSAAARIARAALDPEVPIHEVPDLLEEQGRREVAALQRYNGVLSTIASVAPLMGLLGTILGLISMFQSVAGDGQSMSQISADIMASGIWKALLTTAAGLVVAIPALLAGKWLNARVDGHAERLEDYASQLARWIKRHREPGS